MNNEIYYVLSEILESRKNLSNCNNLNDFLTLIHKKPPFYYKKKESIVRDFLDCLVDKYGGVDAIMSRN